MTTISAQDVKALRDRTGLGMMDCKRALQECNGDADAAITLLRKSGSLKAERKSGRIAAEGVVALARPADGSAIVALEVNSETDFVARDEGFLAFVNQVAQVAADENPADVDALAACTLEGKSIQDVREELVARTGENLQLRRIVRLEADGAQVAGYVHNGRLAAIVRMEGGDEALAADICRHIVAMTPQCIDADDVPAETLEKERAVFTAQAEDSGKPAEIIAKMVEGRLRKYLSEITLTGQEHYSEDESVGKILKKHNARVLAFERLVVGEGIEKKQEDFAEEVRKQAEGG